MSRKQESAFWIKNIFGYWFTNKNNIFEIAKCLVIYPLKCKDYASDYSLEVIDKNKYN